jgi:hypothetical protein
VSKRASVHLRSRKASLHGPRVQLYLTKPDYDEGFLERILWEDRERVNSEEAYRKIYQTNSGALYFAQCENPNETWLPLLEKAYAKAHGDYAAIEGGFTGEGIEDLTGGVTSEIYTTDILDKVLPSGVSKNAMEQASRETNTAGHRNTSGRKSFSRSMRTSSLAAAQAGSAAAGVSGGASSSHMPTRS